MSTPYVHAHADLQLANADMEAEAQRHGEAVRALNARIVDAKRRIALGDAGLDIDRIALALTVLRVEGRPHNEGHSAVQDAIADLLKGGGRLRVEYFGAKDYDRWDSQRSDHAYGFGPRHGHIVFSIGLRHEARTRALTDAEIDACVYYLNNLKKIQEAEGRK